KSIEASAARVGKLSAHTTAAMSEHETATSELAQQGEAVRRAARQSARAVAEQAGALAALSAIAARQSQTMAAIVTATTEHSKGTEQLSQGVTEVRGRMRDIAAAMAQHARDAMAAASDVGHVAKQVAALRQANAVQARALGEVTSVLAE